MTVAIILSGCGVYDGTEIHEAVLTMLALARHGEPYVCLAPNRVQAHVSDHLTQEHQAETRHALYESARIARGEVVPLDQAQPQDYQAAIYPGGFGVASTLCDFISQGARMSLPSDVAYFGQTMAQAAKPQGFLCIAPVLISAMYGAGVEQTIGADAATAEAISAMGGLHRTCDVTQAVIDSKRRVVSAPAYMLAQNILEVAQSVDALVDGVVALMQQT